MKPDVAAKGASAYVVGDVPRFNQKNDMFKRRRWDEDVAWSKKFDDVHMPREDKPGYTLKDLFFANAGWWVELAFAKGVVGGKEGLYAWDAKQWGETKPPKGLKLEVDDPSETTRVIKKAAKFFGASLVGVCELDRRWIYSDSYDLVTMEHTPIDIPEDFKYAIAIAVEMDYEGIQTSPTWISGAATGMGYSLTAFVAGVLAQYIRGLGWKALPLGNDTALSVPIAIDAGLGELSRAGIMITEEFGPRVRISKVFTDLPLVPDKPVEFGVWDFCMKCGKCAETCPGQAMEYGDPGDKVHNISNNSGLYRWPVNAEKCFRYWTAMGTSCATCIRVCPFNKTPGWLHDSVRWGIKHTPWLNPLFIKVDDALGYGKQLSGDKFWNS